MKMIRKNNTTVNMKRLSVPAPEKLKEAFANAPQVKAAKNHPLFFVGGFLAISLTLALLFFLKTSAMPDSKDVIKPNQLILKSQIELMDEATSALNKDDFPTFAQLVGEDAFGVSEIKDPNLPNSKGVPLIITAAEKGNADAVQMLLSRGIEINQPSSTTGDTAIIAATRNGNVEMTLLLMGGGADVNSRNRYGATPLLGAIEASNRDIVNVLLSRGADNGATPENLIYFVNKKNLLGVEAMLKTGITPNIKSSKGYPPLVGAAALGDLNIVDLLIAYKAEINAFGPDGSTALLNAAKYQRGEVAYYLLSQGADVNIANKYGETPLFWAAYYGNKNLANELLAAGADYTVKNQEGFTPKKVATLRNFPEVVTLIDNHHIAKRKREQELKAQQERGY